MKKLLIVSLFLLGIIGLMAQIPHLAQFDLQTEAGGYHATGTIGFKVCTTAPAAFGGAEQWTGVGNFMYWNWPDSEGGENSAPTVYVDPSDAFTPGRIVIQMQPLTNWGPGMFGDIPANFYFIDGEGNETGPYTLSKSSTSETFYPTVVAWGGPAAPTAPDAWATVVAPVDGSGDASADVLLEWSYAGTVAVTGYELSYRNISAGTDPVTMDLAADVFEYQLTDLMMDEYTYGWTVKPFTGTTEAKVYPEGEVPAEWTFTTAAIPVIYPDNATNFFPADNATGVALDVVLTWEYSDESPAVNGFEINFNGEVIAPTLPAGVYSYNPGPLAYATTYTWSVTPYIVDDAGAKSYLSGVRRATVTRSSNATKATRDSWLTPELTLVPLMFTTMDAPVVAPSLATLVGPATDVPAPVDAQLEWAYEGTPVTGFEVIFNGAEAVEVAADVMTYNPGELMYNTEYTWSVRPYIDPAPVLAPGKGLKNRITLDPIYPGEDVVDWTFTTTDTYTTEEAVVIEGTPVTVQLSAVFTNPVDPTWTPNGPTQLPEPSLEHPLMFPLPGNAGAFQFGASIAQGVAGTFTYTFLIPGGNFDGVAYLDGVQQFAGTFLGGVVTVTIGFTGAKDLHEVVITGATLPVELSSFTAVAHANEYVTLNWVTESESNLQGYNVYRAETESFQQAMRINPTTVAANNATQTTNYSYTDREVETATYYYWLEVAELSNENTFHGPIVVTVEDDAVVPGLTETTFRNFGPSPFTTSTSTTLRVKEGETASVVIYNLLGQVVRRESFNAGEHNFEFNGRDLNNKSVANGIYFVKMTSPTQSKSFKIVKIK